MSKMNQILAVVAATLLMIVACGDSDERGNAASADSLLHFVPADTPYVFATTGAAPDDVIDKLMPQVEVTLSSYQRIIRAVAENAQAEARDNDEDVEWLEKGLPFLDELDSLLSVDGFADAGIDRDSQFALYGAGLLPVLRVTLSDSDLMEKTIVRLEEKAGEQMTPATVDGLAYRYVGDDEARLLVAISDGDLVLSIVPASLSEEYLKRVLGLTVPDESIADAGTLGAIADKYDYEDYVVGMFDFERIASTFLEPQQQSGTNGQLLSLMDYDVAELSDTCKVEFGRLAGVAPRMVAGYGDFNVGEISTLVVLELREDIASAVSTLSAPVPGLGVAHDGMFSFGMSLDLLALRTFYSNQLDAIEETPFECEHLAEIQAGVASGRDILEQPIPPIVYGFKGFLAVVNDAKGLNLAAAQPPTELDMRMLVATDNAEGLLAMGSMFSPELASLDLESNGEPVRLNLPQVDALGQIAYIAMSDEAFGISVGEDMQDGLADMLAADPSGETPFVYIEMDAAAYYDLISGSMVADGSDPSALPEVQEAVLAMNEAARELLERISFSVNLTENGVEFDSGMSLRD